MQQLVSRELYEDSYVNELSIMRQEGLNERLFTTVQNFSMLRRLLRSGQVARVVIGKPSQVFVRGSNELAR